MLLCNAQTAPLDSETVWRIAQRILGGCVNNLDVVNISMEIHRYIYVKLYVRLEFVFISPYFLPKFNCTRFLLLDIKLTIDR